MIPKPRCECTRAWVLLSFLGSSASMTLVQLGKDECRIDRRDDDDDDDDSGRTKRSELCVKRLLQRYI